MATPAGTSASRGLPQNLELKSRAPSASASTSGAKPRPAISVLYKSCLSSYDGVQTALLSSTCEQAKESKYDRDGLIVSIQDARSKFKAWAQNIAAFQSPKLRTSLDFRLKEATGIRERIVKILQELQISLSEALPIICGEEPNDTWKPGSFSDSESDDGTSSQTSEEGTRTSELEELFTAIHDSNLHLMKLSMVIRSSPARDDYLKAASRYQFDPRWDIGHVKEKHGKLNRCPDWLVERLGKAITRRRQFLKYREEHHGKLSKDWDEAPKEVIPITIDIKPAQTIVASTKATTFVESRMIPEKPPEDDIVSFDGSETSYDATTMGDDAHARLTVPQHPIMAFEGVPFVFGQPFQCPYCYTEQIVKNRFAWKKHVFRDLKPYVCTFKECTPLRMFQTRHEWFGHEIQNHRRQWACEHCEQSPCTTKVEFIKHVSSKHGIHYTAGSSQLDALILQSEEPMDRFNGSACSLCEDWEENMQGPEKDSKRLFLNDGRTVEPYGTLKQFRRHLGRHMEQLALFALPKSDGDEMEDESSGEDEDDQSNPDSAGTITLEAKVMQDWSPDVDEITQHDPNYEQLFHLLKDMRNHASSWPFLHPVSKDEVPDYYDVIKEPMDLATIEAKLEADNYPTPADFIRDATLIFNNCRKYNNETTPYAKCAVKLEKYMWTRIKAIPEWSHLDSGDSEIEFPVGNDHERAWYRLQQEIRNGGSIEAVRSIVADKVADFGWNNTEYYDTLNLVATMRNEDILLILLKFLPDITSSAYSQALALATKEPKQVIEILLDYRDQMSATGTYTPDNDGTTDDWETRIYRKRLAAQPLEVGILGANSTAETAIADKGSNQESLYPNISSHEDEARPELYPDISFHEDEQYPDISSYEEKLEAEHEFPKTSTPRSSETEDEEEIWTGWSWLEKEYFPRLLQHFGTDWPSIAEWLGSKTAPMVADCFHRSASSKLWKEIAAIADAKLKQGEPTIPIPPREALSWSRHEITFFVESLSQFGSDWAKISQLMAKEPPIMVKEFYETGIRKYPEWEQLVKDADAKLLRGESVGAFPITTESQERNERDVSGSPSSTSQSFPKLAVGLENSHTGDFAETSKIKCDEEASSNNSKVDTTSVIIPCMNCTYTFSRLPDLEKHIREIHINDKFSCMYPGCGYSSTRAERTKKHIELKHPGYLASAADEMGILDWITPSPQQLLDSLTLGTNSTGSQALEARRQRLLSIANKPNLSEFERSSAMATIASIQSQERYIAEREHRPEMSNYYSFRKAELNGLRQKSTTQQKVSDIRETKETYPTEKGKLRESTKSNEYFVPDTGVALDVMRLDVLRYLGKDAAVRSGSHEDPRTGSVQQGYIITSRVEPTMSMVAYRSRAELPPIISLRDNTPLVVGHSEISNAHGLQDEELPPLPPSEPSVVPDTGTEKKQKEVKEKAAETGKAAENAEKVRMEIGVTVRNDIAAGAPLDTPREPLRFKDAVGRKFSFPFHLCATWTGMEELIKQAFLHIEVIGPHVADGHYDLIGPNGEIILPQVWETMVEPGWSVTMHMWPMPEPPRQQFGPQQDNPEDRQAWPRSRNTGARDPRRPSGPPGSERRGGNPNAPPPPPPGSWPPGRSGPPVPEHFRAGGGPPVIVLEPKGGSKKKKPAPKNSGLLSFLGGGSSKSSGKGKRRKIIDAKDTPANLNDIGDKTELPAGVETPGLNSITTTKKPLQETQSPITEPVEESQAQDVGVKKNMKLQDSLGRIFSFPFKDAAT